MKNKKKVLQFIVAAVIAVLGVFGGYETFSSQESEASELKVHFIDVGQADCILVESEGNYMLVDAGNNEDADVITSYLNKQGVESLEYVIGTHPHEDHIGSLDQVIDSFDIKTVILPEKEHTTKTFEDVITAIEQKNLKITAPEVGKEYRIGSARFTIVAPNDTYGEELNNWSVGIRLTNGTHSFFMCGDAEKEAEQDILSNGMDISSEVYKVSHHGASTSTSDAFLKAISPKFAVICVGKDNTYGHPTKKTLNRLLKAGVQVFRTDEQGTIVADCSGDEIKWSTER